jgi:hypothetical protein
VNGVRHCRREDSRTRPESDVEHREVRSGASSTGSGRYLGAARCAFTELFVEEVEAEMRSEVWR